MDIFSPKDKQAILRLYDRAKRKKIIADLLLHAYDDHYQCNIREIMRYLASEPPESTLKEDVMTLLKMMQMGIETHEVLGRERVNNLIEYI